MNPLRQIRLFAKSTVIRAFLSEIITKLLYGACVLLCIVAYISNGNEVLFVVFSYMCGATLLLLLTTAIIRTVHFLQLEREMFVVREAGRFFLLFAFTTAIFAFLQSIAGLKRDDKISHDYIDAVYFSLTTITTLGYGDLLPQRSMQLLTSMEAFFGLMTAPLLASIIWMIVDLKAGPNDKSMFKQLSDNVKRHVEEGGVDVGDVLTNAILSDLSKIAEDDDAVRNKVISVLTKDTQYGLTLRIGTVNVAIESLCEAYPNEELMDGKELKPEVIEAVNLAKEVGSYSWHLWLFATKGSGKGVKEFLASLKEAVLDEPKNDEEA